MSGSLFYLIGPLAADVNNSSTISEAKVIVAENSTQSNKQWNSYKVDGSSSASKLVAKRSHSVSKQDETGLAVFLGIIVIAVIVFFLNPFGEKK